MLMSGREICSSSEKTSKSLGKEAIKILSSDLKKQKKVQLK